MHPALFLIWVISDAEGISKRTEQARSDAYLRIPPLFLAVLHKVVLCFIDLWLSRSYLFFNEFA